LALVLTTFILAITSASAVAQTAPEQNYANYQETLNRLLNESDDSQALTQLIREMRRFRIRLLDRQRFLEASDDDAEAAVVGQLIERVDGLILDAERHRADCLEPVAPCMQGLPEGLEKGLVLHYLFLQISGIRTWDLSPQGNQGQVQGAKWTQHSRLGGAYWFDGVDDYIQIDSKNNLDLQQAFTLSLSIYRQTSNEEDRSTPEALLSRGDREDSDLWLVLTPSGSVGAGFKNATGKTLRLSAEPSRYRVANGRWTHLVLSYDGRTVRSYIDGREDKRVYLPGVSLDSAHPIHIGRMGKGEWQYGFRGKLDALTIWNRALSEAEVRGLWVTLNGLLVDPMYNLMRKHDSGEIACGKIAPLTLPEGAMHPSNSRTVHPDPAGRRAGAVEPLYPDLKLP
jgi:hypothetical protein